MKVRISQATVASRSATASVERIKYGDRDAGLCGQRPNAKRSIWPRPHSRTDSAIGTTEHP
jgi:hypothetical protein